MAEEIEGQETGAEASGAGVDPAAVALALGGASREIADAFLNDQRTVLLNQNSLIDIQKHHLHRQLTALDLGIWEKRLGVLLRIATGFVGLAVAAGLAMMIWDAAHANGLVIEAFSVPPDMASRGINGQVVATQMLDKLSGMQNASGTSRPAQSYANNWGNDLKVEIPETGISVGEVYSFLRGWLGHETHITGEVYRTATGIAVTARAGADVGGTYAGAETDLDALVQKAAEHVYGTTQPFRYAQYLFRNPSQPGGAGRFDEARAIFTRLTSDSDRLERAWAWFGVGILPGNTVRASVIDHQKAIALNPEIPAVYYQLGFRESDLGRNEAMLATYRNFERLLNRSPPPNIDVRYIDPYRLIGSQQIAFLLGDYTDAISLGRSGTEIPNDLGNIGPETFRRDLAVSLARQHDGIAALVYWRDMPPTTEANSGLRSILRLQTDAALENWQAVVASEASVEKTFAGSNPGSDINVIIGTLVRPFVALAKTKLGDIAGAEAAIATTASDCYDCIRMRGNIAAVEGNWGRADFWFARAVHDGPSIPMAYADWGQSFLMRGDPDAAIAKFTIANQKGPHFADPLEGWGEALMKKNQSHLALAKFEEANKYAPNWGRLHLKWGEALAFAGRKDEAQKQYALAAGLDLSSADKIELAKVRE